VFACIVTSSKLPPSGGNFLLGKRLPDQLQLDLISVKFGPVRLETLLRREWKDNSGVRPVIELGDFPAMDESVWVECFPVKD